MTETQVNGKGKEPKDNATKPTAVTLQKRPALGVFRQTCSRSRSVGSLPKSEKWTVQSLSIHLKSDQKPEDQSPQNDIKKRLI